ncbi:hypothetical protein DYBT9623_05499 [Dyadobacter sp. CECT 9623]|uniref:Uncharacterized protein n=1 Tax=Dyadobacter linearis TaxID=2823330 RepID=A0ABN7RFB7_9BACT|nr:hypothetical protein DYBT9623_05499 [Dyadobacter sp. CECT 9623]
MVKTLIGFTNEVFSDIDIVFAPLVYDSRR